jgi:hypothetical protein
VAEAPGVMGLGVWVPSIVTLFSPVASVNVACAVRPDVWPVAVKVKRTPMAVESISNC